jgi:hypothetical protein
LAKMPLGVRLNQKRELLTSAYTVGVIALFAVGVWVRVKHLNDGVRYDEAFTFLNYAGIPFGEAVALYNAPNNHLLNTVLVKWTAAILGDEPARWRLPNLLAGLGAMAFVAALARRYFGRIASLAALAVVAISPPFAHYAVLARGYALAAFFAVAALFIIEKRYGDGHYTKLVWLLPLCAALSCYAVPTALIFIAALAAYDFYLVQRSPQRKKKYWLITWAAAAAITALLYLPLLVGSGWRAVFANPYVSRVTGEGRWSSISEYVTALGDEKSWGWGGLWLWGPLAAAGLLVSATRCKRFAVLLSIAAGLTAIIIVAGFAPPTRTFIFWVPLVALGIGGLFQTTATLLKNRGRTFTWVGVALAVSLTAACAYVGERRGLIELTERTGAAPGARDVAAVLAGVGGPVIVNSPYNCPVIYYSLRNPAATPAFMVSSPQAYTKEIRVVVPAASTVTAEVETCLGPGWVAHEPRYVRRAGRASIWEATVVSYEPREKPPARHFN